LGTAGGARRFFFLMADFSAKGNFLDLCCVFPCRPGPPPHPSLHWNGAAPAVGFGFFLGIFIRVAAGAVKTPRPRAGPPHPKWPCFFFLGPGAGDNSGRRRTGQRLCKKPRGGRGGICRGGRDGCFGLVFAPKPPPPTISARGEGGHPAPRNRKTTPRGRAEDPQKPGPGGLGPALWGGTPHFWGPIMAARNGLLGLFLPGKGGGGGGTDDGP